MTRSPADATQAAGPPVLEEVTGAVLCGGRSLRFGSDKALQVVGGRTLLARALDSLAPAGERLLVGRAYVGMDARHVPDLRPGMGPLAGLEAALHAAGSAWVALAACDLPCLSPAYWRLLCARAGDDRPVCVRQPNGDFEPLAALYPRSALRAVAARLDAGELDLQALLVTLDARWLGVAEVESACGPAVLRNVNRPRDLPAGDPCGA